MDRVTRGLGVDEAHISQEKVGPLHFLRSISIFPLTCLSPVLSVVYTCTIVYWLGIQSGLLAAAWDFALDLRKTESIDNGNQVFALSIEGSLSTGPALIFFLHSSSTVFSHFLPVPRNK